MKDLMLAELRRFLRPAMIFAGAHLLLLLFANRMVNLLQQPYLESQVWLALAILAGLALALVQVGGYRRPAAWMWLLHRPLSPSRIFAALVLAASALLTLALLLPQLVLVAGLDLFSSRVVDLRHYAGVLLLWCYALIAWLAGCHAVLSRYRLAIAVLALPLFLGLHLVSVHVLWIPVLACLLWLCVVALHSVRADRVAPPRSLAALMLTALPLQIGFLLLLFAGVQTAFVTGGILLGTDPLNSREAPAGGLIEVLRASAAESLDLGLAISIDPRAQAWREQLPLLQTVELGVHLQRYPRRQQFSNLQLPSAFADSERGLWWTFSHDRMRFIGRDEAGQRIEQEWGRSGIADAHAFDEVPIPLDDERLLTRDALLDIDSRRQQLHPRLQLDPGEHFISVPEHAFGRTLVLSSQRLQAFRPDREALSAHAPLQLEWSLPLPRGSAQLQSVQLAQLMDGWLVSFVYDDGHRQLGLSQISVVRQPWQQVQWIDSQGAAEVVAERAITRDYPAIYQHAGWLSPLLLGLIEWPESVLDKGLTRPIESEWLPPSTPLRVLAAVLLLGSALLAGLWLRGSGVSTARKRFWLLSCLVLGLPALLSLVCLEPRGAARDA